jgi:DNA-binding MarR family transcriptional regulator
MSEDTQRLWTALVAVYQPVLREVVDALERDAGIDSGTYSALAYLDQAGGRMRIGDLHALLRVRYSQPGLSRLVQRMERDGVVGREIDPDDRRGTVVSLTRGGRTRFRRAHDVYTKALDEHLGRDLPGATVASLTRALEGVAARRGDRA